MTLKDIDFSVKMYGTTPIIQSNYDVAYTGDESSINLRFAVTDEPELEGATAIVHLKFADSSHIERSLELTESVFSYTLKGTENKHAGVVRADIIITKGGAKFTRAGHKFKIDTSLDANVPLIEYAVDTLDTLVDGAEEWLLQTQIDFGTAQSQRADEWVADNDARADEFAESQTDRTSAFNASEAARTTDFNASETGRSNTFTVNENAREAAAESGEAARGESFELSEYERTITFGESEAGRSTTFNASEAGRTIAFNLAEEARSEGYANDHNRAGTDHTTAISDHDTSVADHDAFDESQAQRAEDFNAAQTGRADTFAASEAGRTTIFNDAEEARATGYAADHSRAGTDHTAAANDHTLAGTDHTTAANDHTLAGTDHTRAEADHTRAEADSAIVTTFDGRVTKLESNDEPMHYDKVLGEYTNVGKYWDAYRNGKIYTTEFNNYEVSPSPTGTKKDANTGLVAVPSTNLVAGQDDYANIGIFKPVEVNAYVDANDDYHITAIKGDGRFKRDGTNGDVYIMNMLGYVKRFDTPTTWGYSYSDTLHAGFNVLPEAVKPDGTVRPFLLHAKYIAGVGSDGKLASISGVNPEYNGMSHDGQITKFKAKGEQYSGKTTHDDFWMKLMLFLKYATTNSEAVMKGCISYYLQYQPSIYEVGVSRVVLTNAQANALIVGSRVSIGNYVGFAKTDDRASALVHNIANRVKITNIEALPDGLNSAVYVDAPIFDTNATTTITTLPWASGACDNVLGNDGSPNSNTSGKDPLIINGIETMVGGYEVIQNLMIYNDNTDPLNYKIKVYTCYDAKLYTAGSPSANYKLLSVLMAQTNNTWQYISKLGVDPNHPTALIPIAATASSTTGFSDGIYTNAPTTGYRAWRSLGYLSLGSLFGFFFVYGGSGLGSSSWSILGRLSATGRSRGELA